MNFYVGEDMKIADAVIERQGASLQLTGVDLLTTKFQLFNFKYKEVITIVYIRPPGAAGP